MLSNLKRVRIVSSKKSNFTKTKDGKIGDILAQRHSQRNKLFWFSLDFVTVTTLFVLGLIGAQAYLNFHNYKVKLVGLVGIITKSIWDDKPYLEAGVIEERKKLRG